MTIIKPDSLVPSKLKYPKVIEKYKEIFLNQRFCNSFFGFDFVLHDGPPYANGNLHVGTIFNKTLKDIAIRYQILLGNKVNMILGWDCHGLPIENKIKHNKEIKNKKLNILEFRKLCAEYADLQTNNQRNQTKENFFIQDRQIYQTKSREYAKKTIETLYNINRLGLLLKINMPTYYSLEDQTNLSFSEIEYQDVEHTYVYFMVDLVENSKFKLLVYTTQPWTIVGNRLICINNKIQYCFFEHNKQNIITSVEFVKRNNITKYNLIDTSWILKHKYSIPQFKIHNQDIMHHDEVDDTGTSILHCAPAHGYNDYEIFKEKYPNAKVENCINKKGFIQYEGLEEFSIISKDHNANEIIINILERSGKVFKSQKFTHRYPVSWRSKKPVYIICLEQIVITLNEDIINSVAYNASLAQWYGHEVLNTFVSTIKARNNNWCISRQRGWGTPCALFYNKKTNAIICNEELDQRILELILEQGEDVWFKDDYIESLKIEFFNNDPNIVPVQDTLDVWFDSGCSSIYMKEHHGIKKIDLICEGRDQHRGWIQTSAIISTILKNNFQCQKVMVHGFVNFDKNTKISKSNSKTTQMSDKILSEFNDIIRLIIFGSQYGKDIIFSEDIMSHAKKTHLKIYNTMRYFINMYSKYQENKQAHTNIINIYFCEICEEELTKYHDSLKKYQYQIAYKCLLNITNTISEYIRINRQIMYCGDPNSQKYIEVIDVLRYLSKILYQVCYPVIPSTLIYILTHIESVNDEVDVVDFIKTNSIKLKSNANSHNIIKNIEKIYDKINYFVETTGKMMSIQQNSEIGILVSNKHQEYFISIQEFCQVSFVESSDQYKNYDYIGELQIEESDEKIYIIDAKALYSKCDRCWNYFKSLQEQMCSQCYEVVQQKKPIHNPS